jgi:CRISPR-associated protein Cas1
MPPGVGAARVKGVVAIQEQGLTLAARSGALVVLRENAEIRRIRMAQIGELHLYGDVELTARARQLLMREGVDVLILGERGHYVGRLVGFESAAGERRLAQFRYLSNGVAALNVARRLVDAKIGNQRTYLQRLAREKAHDLDLVGHIAGLQALSRALVGASSIAEVMGFEGRASVLYYRGLGMALKHPGIRFERRTRRPPRDPANAALSFGYTLLCTKVESAVRKAGLDVHVGALHQVGRGKPAMALDVMEPFRIIVDRMVWRMLNRGQLVVEDFESVERWDEDVSEPVEVAGGIEVRDGDDRVSLGPATYLAASGRAVFLKEWGQLWRKKREYEAYGMKLELGAILDAEVQALAREFEAGTEGAERWVPWVFR